MSQNVSLSATAAGTYPFAGRDVARMAYGAMQLGRLSGGDPATARGLLRRVLTLGVNHLDTAEFYGNGFANAVIAEVTPDFPNVLVATKVGADPNPQGPVSVRPAQRPAQLRASVEDNLRSLRLEQLPLVNLRRLDVGPGLAASGDQIVDIDDQLAQMIALRDEGKIGAIGLSAVSLENLQRALPAGIACVQNAYSVLTRHFEDLLDLCTEQHIAWVPFFPLGGAHFPESPKVVDNATVQAIAMRLHVTAPQLGLAWLLAHRPNICLIPGTASRAHLEENIAAAAVRLDAATLAELDALATSESSQ